MVAESLVGTSGEASCRAEEGGLLGLVGPGVSFKQPRGIRRPEGLFTVAEKQSLKCQCNSKSIIEIAFLSAIYFQAKKYIPYLCPPE